MPLAPTSAPGLKTGHSARSSEKGQIMHTEDTTLEDLLTIAVRQARLLCAAARGIYCGRTTRETATAARILQGLEAGNILRDDLDGGLQTLHAHLSDAIAAETVGYRRVFDGHHDPEGGDVGVVREIPVLSDRGAALLPVLRRCEALVAARDAARDRLCAEQSLRSLL